MMITCPECQKEISDMAVSCPFCGYPIQATTRPPRTGLTETPHEPQQQPQQSVSVNNQSTFEKKENNYSSQGAYTAYNSTPVKKKDSPLAIGAIICCVLGYVFGIPVVGVVGTIFAIVDLIKNKDNEELRKLGSIVALVLTALAIIVEVGGNRSTSKIANSTKRTQSYADTTAADNIKTEPRSELSYDEFKEAIHDTDKTGTTDTYDRNMAIPVTAERVYKEMDSNQVACKQKYDGKLVEISGKVQSVGTDIMDDLYVSLDVGDEWAIMTPMCYLGDEYQDFVANLSEGDSVKFIGKCEVGSMVFKVYDCQPE